MRSGAVMAPMTNGPRGVDDCAAREARRSAAETQPLDDSLVFLRFGRLQVVQQLAALVHHLHQPAAGSMVTLVRVEVTAEAVDALGQQCNLHFRRAGVFRVAAELGEDAALLFAR